MGIRSSMQHIICNRNVITNFLHSCHAINPNNETCLVTCAVSLTCATWLMYIHAVFPLIYPSTRIQVYIHNIPRLESVTLPLICTCFVCTYICMHKCTCIWVLAETEDRRTGEGQMDQQEIVSRKDCQDTPRR